MDEEELSRWQVVADRVVQGGPEPETWDPMGETLSQPGEGPRSQCPRDDLEWHGRPGLTGSPVPQLPSSSVLLLEDRIDPSEGQSTADPGEMIAEEGPSEELALTQATATSSQGGRTARWAYTPKEHWEPRFREEYEAFKAARGDRRFEIWLGWPRRSAAWSTWQAECGLASCSSAGRVRSSACRGAPGLRTMTKMMAKSKKGPTQRPPPRGQPGGKAGNREERAVDACA